MPSPDTFPRPRAFADPCEPAALYVRSYLLIRTVVGLIGILLPVALIAGTNWGGVHVGNSLSSFYHSSMQDVFVGGLCVIAVLLATYLAGQPRTWDFLLSLGAGLALLVVVFFPVRRPGVPPGAPWCGSTPAPSGCSPVQQLLGEELTERIHLIAAGVCFVLIAALSFLFARRERVYGGNLVPAGIHVFCGMTILLAVAGAGLAGSREFRLGPVPLLYAAETVAVWAFAASWLLAGRDLWLRLLRPRARVVLAVPRCPDPRDAPLSSRPAGSANPFAASPAAGWYRDPYPDLPYRWSERWFDGRTWTAAVRPAPGHGSDFGLPGSHVHDPSHPRMQPPPAELRNGRRSLEAER